MVTFVSSQVNDGTIQTDIGIGGSGTVFTNTATGRIFGHVFFLEGGVTLRNENGGIIRLSAQYDGWNYGTQLIAGSSGEDTILNSGIINGDISLGGGNDRVVADREELFGEVQSKLNEQARRHLSKGDQAVERAPLVGKLFDAAGEPMSPTFSKGQSGRLYRYYASASLMQGRQPPGDLIRRVPAVTFENMISGLVQRWTASAAKPLSVPLAVRPAESSVLIDMPPEFAADIAGRLENDERIAHSSRKLCRVVVPTALPMRGGKRLIVAGTRTAKVDPVLVAALRKAHAMVRLSRGKPLIDTAPRSRYERDVLRLAFLAPDLQRDILAGRQPPTLTSERLRQTEIPICWKQQRRVLGWSSAV